MKEQLQFNGSPAVPIPSTMRIPACRFQRVAIALLWLLGVALCLPVAAD